MKTAHLNNWDKFEVLGVFITNLTSKELNDECKRAIEASKKDIFANVNIHAMNFAYRLDWFKTFLNEAVINFCDGEGVRMGASLLGYHIKEKITYNRWIWELAELSEKEGFSWYMLGSKQEVLEKCSHTLKGKYPKLNIIGSHHGYIKDEEVSAKVASEIRQKKPNILILGMGMPIQEKWLVDNFENLDFNVALTGGAVFEYISGQAKMTPNIFYKLKLEWFFRFLQEPRRLFKRYFIGNPLFFIRIFLQKLRNLRKVKEAN